MSQVITKRSRVSRRRFLKGLTLAGGAVQVGLPPLVSMFNSTGTAYAAEAAANGAASAIESRFVFWFNGNGIPERYWIPAETGADFRFTPCLSPARAVPQRHPRAERSGQPGGERLPDPATATTKRSAASSPALRSPVTAPAAHRSIRRLRPRSAASRASARSRSACRRSPSARASSAT